MACRARGRDRPWLVRRRRATARATALRDRACRGRRQQLVPAVEWRPAPAGMVQPQRPRTRRARPEAAHGHARLAWRGAGRRLLRHAGGRLHGQPGAARPDARRRRLDAFRRRAARETADAGDGRRGGRLCATLRRRGPDRPPGAPVAAAGARRWRSREPVRRGRDAARPRAGADGARGHLPGPRGAGRDARGVRRHARRPGVAHLRAGRARLQHRLAQAAGADPLPRAGPPGDETDTHGLLDRCIGPRGAA